MDDSLNEAVLTNFPLLAAPVAGLLPAPSKAGMRFVASRCGLFQEMSTPWLYWLMPIAQVDADVTPYGSLAAKVELRFGAFPKELWTSFALCARAALPNEVAALFVWNPQTGAWRMAMRRPIFATADQIDYEEPQLEEGEVAVVDIHSHGHHPAFFSKRDDADDHGSIKLSVVMGKVEGQPEVAARLMCLKRHLPVVVRADGGFNVKLRDA